ncbi:hypothetical protein BUALT_Bualt02G0211600 [Buddleja alternifolia]|uniref:Uncharacterized protein n=1 Tax=Buddleja alternifolia TaxID=168488 RepID=A0AAV6Y215_9LAMI|nr:hypothetical protein BUALT_Bualt02G0211600 [Buddleja alternifolia]
MFKSKPISNGMFMLLMIERMQEWTNLIFFGDEFAQVAFELEHVEIGHQIYVTGRQFEFSFDCFPGRKQHCYAASSTGSAEELWQPFANPMEWWDNRKNKLISFIHDLR